MMFRSMPTRPAVQQHESELVVKLNRRDGFTLIEVVIALGLTLFLMTLVYTALDSYYTLSTKGRRQITQSQIARQIFERIALDLRSVVFVPREEDEEIDDDEEIVDDEESFVATDTVLTFVDTDAALEEGPTGLIGNASSLILHTSALQTNSPAKRGEYFELASALDPTQQTSDELIVEYLMANQGGDGVAGMIGSNLPETIESRSDIRGLARLQADAAQMLISDAVDVQLLAENAYLMADEIVFIQFAYYENGETYEVWDSREYNRLPQAVEVKIGFRKDQREFGKGSRFTTSMDEPEKIFRKVIALPLAAPYIEETY